MDAGEIHDIEWRHGWQIEAAPPGLDTWVVDDGGELTRTRPLFFAFQTREAQIRTQATLPRFSPGGRRDVRYGEPPEPFTEMTGGARQLPQQEIFVFAPGALPISERMPWLRLGVHIFFDEQEASMLAESRRNRIGTAVAVAGAGGGTGRGSPA